MVTIMQNVMNMVIHHAHDHAATLYSIVFLLLDVCPPYHTLRT